MNTSRFGQTFRRRVLLRGGLRLGSTAAALFSGIIFLLPGATWAATQVVREDALARIRAADEPVGLGSVVDEKLSTAERAARQRVSFALRLRNQAELQARIDRGEVISRSELMERYLPKREAWERVADWVRSRGLAVAEDESNLTVMAMGTVAEVERALDLRFARVFGTDQKDHTSAITPPVLDATISAEVLAVMDLQPHIVPLPQLTIHRTSGNAVLPRTIAEFYNAADLGLDGSGQTIVIMGSAKVDPADLTAFWAAAGLPNLLDRYSVAYPRVFATDPEYIGPGEETMDIQWASAMAPGAKIVYFRSMGMNDLWTWLQGEFAAGRRVHQASYSFANFESVLTLPAAEREARSQYLALIAGLGVSFFCGSGDWGTTQRVTNGIGEMTYNASGVSSPSYPASDPNVTSVGGTTILFRNDQGIPALPMEEGAWSLRNVPDPQIPGQLASGGGVSWYFARPSWQTGPGVPAGDKRCVPDVAAVAASNFTFHFFHRGMAKGAGGTSLGAPVWAGFCALINQARAQKGLPALGLLGPRIYPLNGTASFNPMTKGSNGASDPFSTTATNGLYAVGPNYTMITGLGSPNVGNLVAALTAETPPPPAPTPAPSVPSTPTPNPASSGGGGGGGAPGGWFLLSASILLLLGRRQIVRR